jgi:hypothetical protein
MCAICLSPSFGLIRIYPLSISRHGDVSIWSKLSLQLCVSETDNRQESYKLVDYQVVGKVDSREEKSEILNACILRSGNEDPIDYQNKLKRSIAVVKLTGSLGASLVARDLQSDIVSGSDEDGFAKTQAEFPYKPYLQWTSDQGGTHSTHLVGQEVYMGMIHNQSTPFRVFENLHIGDQDYEHWIVLGNMKDRRNVWVAAHVHRQKKTVHPRTLTSFSISDGTPNGWPYETQEAADARFADSRPLFNFIT